MDDLTLGEVTKFRILSSKFQNRENCTSFQYFMNFKLTDDDRLDSTLIEKIFDTLSFKYGGLIWVKAKLIQKQDGYAIKIGRHELINKIAPGRINKKPKLWPLKRGSANLNTHLPLKIDAYLDNGKFSKINDLRFSIDSEFLDTWKYKKGGKIKYKVNSTLGEIEGYFYNNSPFVRLNQYFKTLRELKLPITYNLKILNRISEEVSTDPLSSPEEIEYIKLLELARFITSSGIDQESSVSDFYKDILNIYELDGEFLKDTDDDLENYFRYYSKYYKNSGNNEDRLRRAVRWINNNFTLTNLSNLNKKIVSFSPLLFGAFSIISFIYVLHSTGWNSTLASSIYVQISDEIFLQVLFFTFIGLFMVLCHASVYSIVAKPYDRIIKKITRLRLPKYLTKYSYS